MPHSGVHDAASARNSLPGLLSNEIIQACSGWAGRRAVAFSRNPVPWALLVAWAVLAAVSLVIPGASLGGRIRGHCWCWRAAIALWPHLDAGSARVPPGGLPQLEPVAVKGMHEAARVTDEGGPRAVGPL